MKACLSLFPSWENKKFKEMLKSVPSHVRIGQNS